MLSAIGMLQEPAVQSMDPHMQLLPTVLILHPAFESWAPPSSIEDDVPPNLLNAPSLLCMEYPEYWLEFAKLYTKLLGLLIPDWPDWHKLWLTFILNGKLPENFDCPPFLVLVYLYSCFENVGPLYPELRVKAVKYPDY